MILLISLKGKPQVEKVLNYYLAITKKNGYFTEILVVDLGNDFSTKNFLEDTAVGRYLGFQMTYFNKSLAINLGLFEIWQRYKSWDPSILICDADVMIDKNTLAFFNTDSKYVIVLDEVIESKSRLPRKAYGIIKCKLSELLAINGYDSNFKGWGFEDHDIIQRISKVNNSILRFGKGIHLSHSDDERIKFYHTNNLAEMRNHNKEYWESKIEQKSMKGTMLEDVSNHLKMNSSSYMFKERDLSNS